LENSKFGGSNIQLSIPKRLELLNSNERVDVTLASGEVVQGLFDSCVGGVLALTLVGTDDKKMIEVGGIEKLFVHS
jgi:hypothetical protein